MHYHLLRKHLCDGRRNRLVKCSVYQPPYRLIYQWHRTLPVRNNNNIIIQCICWQCEQSRMKFQSKTYILFGVPAEHFTEWLAYENQRQVLPEFHLQRLLHEDNVVFSQSKTGLIQLGNQKNKHKMQWVYQTVHGTRRATMSVTNLW